MRQIQHPWTGRNLRRDVVKHLLFLLCSSFTDSNEKAFYVNFCNPVILHKFEVYWSYYHCTLVGQYPESFKLNRANYFIFLLTDDKLVKMVYKLPKEYVKLKNRIV